MAMISSALASSSWLSNATIKGGHAGATGFAARIFFAGTVAAFASRLALRSAVLVCVLTALGLLIGAATETDFLAATFFAETLATGALALAFTILRTGAFAVMSLLAAAFFATGFFAVAFFAAGFFTVGFLAANFTGFLAAVFLGAGFFTADFFATTFFAGAFAFALTAGLVAFFGVFLTGFFRVVVLR